MGLAPLRQAPSHEAALLTEALRGERVTIYESDEEGWAWGQLKADGYVGWLPAAACSRRDRSRLIRSRRCAPLYSRPFDQAAANRRPAARAQLAVAREQDTFAVTSFGGFVPKLHLVPPHMPSRTLSQWPSGSSATLSVGRQVEPWSRLLRSRAGRADGVRHQMSARHRHAGERAWQIFKPCRVAKRRPHLLERPRRHRARPQQHDPRQCLPYGGGDRTGGRGIGAHRRRRQPGHQREAAENENNWHC